MRMGVRRDIRQINSMSEQWEPVFNYQGLYEVSNQGQVRSLPRISEYRRKDSLVKTKVGGALLKALPDPRGHMSVALFNKGHKKVCRISKLVIQSFRKPCPHGQEVFHIDGDIHNNHLDNLDYKPLAESRNNKSKLNPDKVRKIRDLYKQGFSQSVIAGLFGVHQTVISKICLGHIWKHI